MYSQPILFRSANIYDGLGGEFLNYDLLLSDGVIKEISKSIYVKRECNHFKVVDGFYKLRNFAKTKLANIAPVRRF